MEQGFFLSTKDLPEFAEPGRVWPNIRRTSAKSTPMEEESDLPLEKPIWKATITEEESRTEIYDPPSNNFFDSFNPAQPIILVSV